MAALLSLEDVPPTFTPALQRAAVSASATLEYVARNALASVYAVRLPPGCVGVDLKFRNETRPAGRVGTDTERVGAPANGGDFAVADEHIADEGVAAGAVDHEAAAQQEVLRLDVPHL